VKKRKERINNSLNKNKIPVPNHKNDVPNITCFNCQKLGHFSYQCPKDKENIKHHAHATNMESTY
jgi:hypothetical protein